MPKVSPWIALVFLELTAGCGGRSAANDTDGLVVEPGAIPGGTEPPKSDPEPPPKRDPDPLEDPPPTGQGGTTAGPEPGPPVPECTPRYVRCAGQSLQLCDDGGRWEEIEVCGPDEFCSDQFFVCIGPPMPLEFRCNQRVLELQSEVSGAWLEHETCATACLCNLSLERGNCLPPTCVAGEGRCTGALLEVCNQCRTAFETYLLCPSADACRASSVDCGGP